MMLDRKQLNCEQSLMPCSNHGRGLLTSLEELTYLLHAAEKALAFKTNRNEEHNFDSRKGKKEGGMEGRKEGRMKRST